MDLPSRRALLAWVPPAILTAAAAVLAVRWDDIPPRWVTHWGASGVPNGWSERTFSGVFGPLLLGAVVVTFLECLARLRIGRRARAPELEPLRDAQVGAMRAIAVSLSLVFAFVSVDLPLGPSLPPEVVGHVAVGVTFAGIGVGLAVAARSMSRALRHVRKSGHGAQVEGYHSIYYANPSDRRLWVPKLLGTGWTINFSHPLAWPVMLLLVGIPIGLVIASILHAHSVR
jgi:uncharacterized membrane protein